MLDTESLSAHSMGAAATTLNFMGVHPHSMQDLADWVRIHFQNFMTEAEKCYPFVRSWYPLIWRLAMLSAIRLNCSCKSLRIYKSGGKVISSVLLPAYGDCVALGLSQHGCTRIYDAERRKWEATTLQKTRVRPSSPFPI